MVSRNDAATASAVTPEPSGSVRPLKAAQVVTDSVQMVGLHKRECTYASDHPPQLLTFNGVTAWVFAPAVDWEKGWHCSIDKARLIMQTDGNFVVYDEDNRPRWAADTYGEGNYAIFQLDSNLVVYNRNNQAVGKRSNTCCHVDPYFKLAIQSDGNVVIYDQNMIPQWATNTAH